MTVTFTSPHLSRDLVQSMPCLLFCCLDLRPTADRTLSPCPPFSLFWFHLSQAITMAVTFLLQTSGPSSVSSLVFPCSARTGRKKMLYIIKTLVFLSQTRIFFPSSLRCEEKPAAPPTEHCKGGPGPCTAPAESHGIGLPGEIQDAQLNVCVSVC